MEITFNSNVARKIGANETILLNILIKECRKGRLIKRHMIHSVNNGKTKVDRSFDRIADYRIKKQNLIIGDRYKSVSIEYLHYRMPWITTYTIRNVIYRLRHLNIIDVKHINLIVNDNTNCYAINRTKIKQLKDYCRHHRLKRPTKSSHYIHRHYSYERSSLDPNVKPMINDDGKVIGSIGDYNKPRWTV